MYDLLVIGGGINGAGIARDAAGRGLSVLLVEKDDLAQATSSSSSKLIHGGLRYLEHYDFKLVAQALTERERLLRSAPHIIWPLEFILPHEPHLRPAWLIRLGLFLYDRLGRREILPSSEGVTFAKHLAGKPLKETYKRGFSYADCWVDDARLVVLCAQDARNKGAEVLTHTKCISLKAGTEIWQAVLRDDSGNEKDVMAKCVVNAAGPWVRDVIDDNHLARETTMKTRLSKGSHIILPKIYEGAQAYILQQPDGRIVFAIPYERIYTLIGTTDVDYDGDPEQAEISQQEIDYLCAAVNRSFRKNISGDDVVWHYSGVRPLLDSGEGNLSEVTRDYKLDLDTSAGPPLLNVFGGKITTFRKLSEQAVNLIAPFFVGIDKAWTRTATLPGGDIPAADFEAFLRAKEKRYPWVDPDMLRRYARAYGSAIEDILCSAKTQKILGAHYGDHLYEAEVRYLIRHEWARTIDDILWRRSKLGLHISRQTKEALEQAMPVLRKDIEKENNRT